MDDMYHMTLHSERVYNPHKGYREGGGNGCKHTRGAGKNSSLHRASNQTLLSRADCNIVYLIAVSDVRNNIRCGGEVLSSSRSFFTNGYFQSGGKVNVLIKPLAGGCHHFTQKTFSQSKKFINLDSAQRSFHNHKGVLYVKKMI